MADSEAAHRISGERGDLERAQADMRAILDGLPALIGYWDRDLRNRMANSAYVEYFGLTPEEIRGMHIRDVLGPDLFEKNRGYMERALAGEAQLFDRAIPLPSGETAFTQASYIPDVADGEVRGFFVLVTDITARREAELALEAAEERFRNLFESAPIGMFLVDDTGRIVDINPAGAAMLGRTQDEARGMTTSELTHPDDVEESRRMYDALLAGEVDSYRLEKRFLHRDGHIVWAQLDATMLHGDGAGRDRLGLGQVQDISERRRHQQELEHLADHDALTGLLNRRGFTRELARQCALTRRYGPRGALLLIDLDGFKNVNDSLGHPTGDRLISEVARLIASRVRTTDVVGRLGGDEFAVILPAGTPAEAGVVARMLTALLRSRVIRIDAADIRITASIGFAEFAADANADEMLRRADVAMYRVKAAGRDGSCRYETAGQHVEH